MQIGPRAGEGAGFLAELGQHLEPLQVLTQLCQHRPRSRLSLAAMIRLAVPTALERAGLKNPKSIRLCSSLTFGNRQSLATLPSGRPQSVVVLAGSSAKLFAALRAFPHVCPPKQVAFLSQINPVRLSLTVPLLLSVKRRVAKGTPAWISPSCPVPAQLMGMPDTSKGSVYPVISTGAGNAGGTATEIGQGPETSTGPFKRTSTLVAGNGAGRGAAKVMKTLSICRPAGPTWRTGLIRACQPQAGTWQPYVCPHPGWLVLRSSVAKQVFRRGQEFHTHFSRLLGALDTLRRKGYCRASTRSPC
jgi:hypothetical protein